MPVIAIIVGVVLVLAVLADMVNTLVTTTRSRARWWMTRILYTRTWRAVRVAGHLFSDETRRERFYAAYTPISVLAMLAAWVVQQVIGFGLIWLGHRRHRRSRGPG